MMTEAHLRTPTAPMVPSAHERVTKGMGALECKARPYPLGGFSRGEAMNAAELLVNRAYRDGWNAARARAHQEGVREGLERAAQVARDRLERARNHGPNIELNQNSPGYSEYRAGATVTAEVIMNTIRALATLEPQQE